MTHFRRTLLILVVPIAAAVAATLLLVLQGGFGAGHGRFDRAIGLLGLPSILLLEIVPLPAVAASSDLFAVVWLPAIGNCIVWLLAAAAVRSRRV